MKKLFLIAILFLGCEVPETHYTGRLNIFTYPTDNVVGDHSMVESLFAVVDAWEEVFEVEPSLEVINSVGEAADTYFEFLPDEEMGGRSGWSVGNVKNHSIYLAESIVDNEDLLTKVRIHEFVHVFGLIMINDPNNNHSNSKMFSCSESVELVAYRILEVNEKGFYKCAEF
jgi:hypothetical protein